MEIEPGRLLQTIGAQKIETDILREQLRARDAEIQGLKDALAKTSEARQALAGDRLVKGPGAARKPARNAARGKSGA